MKEIIHISNYLHKISIKGLEREISSRQIQFLYCIFYTFLRKIMELYRITLNIKIELVVLKKAYHTGRLSYKWNQTDIIWYKYHQYVNITKKERMGD